MRTAESIIKENQLVQDFKKFIEQYITLDDIPELFIKENFKDEATIKRVQDSIQAECSAHVYISEIVDYLIKCAKKVIKNKNKKNSKNYLVLNELKALPGIDYYNNYVDPQDNHEGELEFYSEVDLEYS